MVLDGATSLGEQRVESYESDARWFVDAVSRHFLPIWDTGHSFLAALKRTLEGCMQEYEDLTDGKLGSGEIREYELPSASLAAITVDERGISAFRFGDCACYCKYSQGVRSMFGQSKLDSLDGVVVSALTEEIRRGSNLEQARRSIFGLLRRHRSMMNTPDGYGVLSLSNECLNYLESKTLEHEGLTGILLLTDGFSAIERYGNYDMESLFRECEQRGLDDMIREIRGVEREDELLVNFPRLKQHDDASALLLDVAE